MLYPAKGNYTTINMLAKRIIPCLDIRDGHTVKGVNFVNIRNVGDPVELGALYASQGADELVFLDITATHEGRKTFVDLVLRYADALLSAGADKISVNSSAVRNPGFIDDLAKNFGSQFVVLAIDARGDESGHWAVTINGGRIQTEKELFSWALEGESRGAGEILFTSMNHDGTKNGFACQELARMSEMLKIPVIASGGAGTMEHFAEVFTAGKADAGLAASIFHFREIAIPDLKDYLRNQGITVR